MFARKLHRVVVPLLFVVSAVACWPAMALAEASVYDNTTYDQGLWYPVADWTPCGDAVSLAGTERIAKSITLLLNSSAPVTVDSSVSLYDDTGSSLGNAFKPGISLNGPTAVTFDLPSVALTDSLSWIVEFGNRSDANASLGLALYSPPTVGSSEDWFWQFNGAYYGQYWFNGLPVANFGAKLTAEAPEPGTLVVLSTGALAVGLFLRRFRKPA
jgi:hypothetical protein